jgi:hypothetical protein
MKFSTDDISKGSLICFFLLILFGFLYLMNPSSTRVLSGQMGQLVDEGGFFSFQKKKQPTTFYLKLDNTLPAVQAGHAHFLETPDQALSSEQPQAFVDQPVRQLLPKQGRSLPPSRTVNKMNPPTEGFPMRSRSCCPRLSL